MRNYFTYIFYGFGILALLFFSSCEKKDIVPESQEENNITAAIEKIETVYTEGCEKIEVFDPNYVKVETDAPDELKRSILETIEKTYTKTEVLKNNGNRVGVFRNGSCGVHSYLEIYMDSEDDGCTSNQSGWVGSSYIHWNHNKNISLLFCVVDGAYFTRTNVDYAILNLSSSTNWGDAEGLMRYIDNEDDSNDNQTYLDGQSISGWFGLSYFSSNTRLHFYYYKQTTTTNSFPYLGISYGTLGRYGSYQGWIYSDDEDKNNANSAYYYSSYYANPIPTGNVPNIMDVGGNTKLYISKAR
ncbi:MAG TPA: hypothetical protein DCG75_01880 [Bacteroidales bacterium]|nr:hypothetical protein [Bacteroidales bacterium]